ncbi:hypothetical protein DFP72DRAFT_1040396 [Ephemerocybe angulata]|uniref:Uncharacterized protein n=1 Tax=Ephemerocybe angulata TaxID=980116 RepID=A0A8H6IFN1_9AGAR|nr:hypothetical protein DFP72DRAFT_1040396 [Tulosesus angulatus]
MENSRYRTLKLIQSVGLVTAALATITTRYLILKSFDFELLYASTAVAELLATNFAFKPSSFTSFEEEGRATFLTGDRRDFCAAELLTYLPYKLSGLREWSGYGIVSSGKNTLLTWPTYPAEQAHRHRSRYRKTWFSFTSRSIRRKCALGMSSWASKAESYTSATCCPRENIVLRKSRVIARSNSEDPGCVFDRAYHPHLGAETEMKEARYEAGSRAAWQRAPYPVERRCGPAASQKDVPDPTLSGRISGRPGSWQIGLTLGDSNPARSILRLICQPDAKDLYHCPGLITRLPRLIAPFRLGFVIMCGFREVFFRLSSAKWQFPFVKEEPKGLLRANGFLSPVPRICGTAMTPDLAATPSGIMQEWARAESRFCSQWADVSARTTSREIQFPPFQSRGLPNWK